MKMISILAVLATSILCFLASEGRAQDERQMTDAFEQFVRPLLLEHCAECHGSDVQEAGLRVDRASLVTTGGDSGPAVIPGNPDESRLIKAIRYDSRTQMPPDGKLSDDKIRILEEWVRLGAFWPSESEPASSPPDSHSSAGIIAEAGNHWAFQQVTAPAIPDVRNPEWPNNAIDRFVLAKLEEKGLFPSEQASRRELIRRVYYDLVGLPPKTEEITRFESDDRVDAYSELVERLLQSPEYGERWGRHWLDVARYADTKGYVGVAEGDLERREYPFAFSYRDWIISALNNDLGYDQFIKLQISADLMQIDDPSSLAALGFFRVGRVFLNNRHDQIDDKIDAMSRGMLGLTVSCARCHDHKFDPIPTGDYYSLYAIFSSTDEPDDAENKRMLLADSANPHNVRIFKRGNPATHGDEVPRAFLSVLEGDDRKPYVEGSGRQQLAEAIANPKNPLTARVMVNRVWGHHFGRPLVDTPSDFGIRTPRPIHAELLDHLASEFVHRGWSLKELHREILYSRTYQQSSRRRDECISVDSENSLLWRQNRRRLDLEQMRDSMLWVSRSIDLDFGGPSQKLTEAPFSHRRTVYGRVDRQNLPGMFRTFDFANPDSHSPGRFLTTVPQQGLFMMNHPFVQSCASDIANVAHQSAIDVDNKIVEIYSLVLSRQPSESERSRAIEYFDLASPASEGFGHLAQALLMTNEFMFID